MSNLNYSLGDLVSTIRVNGPAAAGATAINCTAVNLSLLGGNAVLGIVGVGALTATQVTSLKVQESDDNSTWSDVTNSQTSNLSDSDGSKLMLASAVNLQKKWVRLVINRATANAVVELAVMQVFGIKSSVPLAKDASVAVQSAGYSTAIKSS